MDTPIDPPLTLAEAAAAYRLNRPWRVNCCIKRWAA
jgi:hypothetical protein